MLRDAFTPNRRLTAPATIALAVASVIALGVAWQLGPAALPKPLDVATALGRLWNEHALFDHLAQSLALNLEAIAWSSALALALAYATVLPALRPAVAGITKLRFTGLVGWGFVFTVLARDGHQLKLWMLVFGMTPFLATAMAAVVAGIAAERFDHARALGMSEWRITYEVVIRGTAADALEAIRQNAAMGWMMLTMVEGVVRSEGGLGALMLNENKHLQLDAVFAVIVVVLVVGVVQDRALASLRRALCPWARG